ncbi:UNKNOWN [Stylonychia lemnae]|uniref:TLC domain-containing protein n=1 Tax=Stylonychia lemnae TaxID=5949 RepID=A0A078AB96_STYLE|nr:UNKNOWN [Stylonychia lemnae]|eukprot:CDW79429.1 UNKNOWN [Stylonychia lemnae]
MGDLLHSDNKGVPLTSQNDDDSLNFFQKMFKGSIQYEYDTRIDEYNWIAIFLVQFVAYFVAQALVRKLVPPPGDVKVFLEKKRMKDYHSYYFQYTSFIHAMIGIILGNTPYFSLHLLAVEIPLEDSNTLVSLLIGFQTLVCHLLAEVSNPFLQIRTALRIVKKSDTWYYKLNDKIFAVVFILARLIVSPILLFYTFEGDNTTTFLKLGFASVTFIQFFWGMKILYNIGVMVKEHFDELESKEKESRPLWAKVFHDVFYAIDKNKQVRLIFSIVNFATFVFIPVSYYGFVRGNLFKSFL